MVAAGKGCCIVLYVYDGDVILLGGNPERYSGRLLCTKNGNPD